MTEDKLASKVRQSLIGGIELAPGGDYGSTKPLGFAENVKWRADGEYSDKGTDYSEIWLLSEEFHLTVRGPLRPAFATFAAVVGSVTEQAQLPSARPIEDDQIQQQARLLDEMEEQLAEKFDGEVVVFSDGQVLASGSSGAEAISRLPTDLRSLPSVVRRISRTGEDEFMGGPKGE